MGDNSVFKQATKSKLYTELAKIEEQAGTIYSSKLLQKIKDNLDDRPTMQEVVGELRDEGYTIEQVAVGANKVTGISLDRENMSLGKEKSNTIQVILENKNNEEIYDYYIKVDNNYYKMHFNDGAVSIDRTESDISNSEDDNPTLTVSSEEETIATATIDSSTNIVTVTAKNIVGTTKITVTCGEYTKTCNIKVYEVTTELEINSVRARIATGYTRWLTATAKPETASQEFEWTSSNTEVATVDNNGVVTAKKKGTATITVKTTDGSNLSKECSVTVDDAVEVATLTDFQGKNTIAKDENGNLITVPGNFKVLKETKVIQGIVIQDKEGNEFVWIPIDSVSTGTSQPADDIRLGRYTFNETNGTPKKEQDADNYNQIVGIPLNDSGASYQELTSSTTTTPAKNLKDFVTKTEANGGYYLARYEASKGSDGKADSQADKKAWAQIRQEDAANAARTMYNSNYIESDLINSYSWDTAIVFIQKYSINKNYANKNLIRSSTLNTGKTSEYECNIYDMASNYMEWSTEICNNTSNSKFVVFRGSCYHGGSSPNYNTGKSFTSYRGTQSTNTYYAALSFRVLLYIK